MFAIASWLNPLGGPLSAFLAVVACGLLLDIVLRSPWTYRLPIIIKGPFAFIVAVGLALLLTPSVQAKFSADYRDRGQEASSNDSLAAQEQNNLKATQKAETERPDVLFSSRSTVRPFVPALQTSPFNTAPSIEPPQSASNQSALPAPAVQSTFSVPAQQPPQVPQQVTAPSATPVTATAWTNVNMQQMNRLVPLLAELRPPSGNGSAVTCPSQDVVANGLAQMFFSAFSRAGLQPQLINEMPRGPEEHGVMIGASNPAHPTKKEVQLQTSISQATGLKAEFIQKPSNFMNFDHLVFVGPQE